MNSATHVHTLAIAEFRKDFPFLADRLDAMRSAAMVRVGGVAESLRDGDDGGAQFSAYPDGNHGDNLTHPTDKAVL